MLLVPPRSSGRALAASASQPAKPVLDPSWNHRRQRFAGTGSRVTERNVMSHDHSPPPFPRNALIIAGTVILLSIMTAAAGRINGSANSAPTRGGRRLTRSSVQ